MTWSDDRLRRIVCRRVHAIAVQSCDCAGFQERRCTKGGWIRCRGTARATDALNPPGFRSLGGFRDEASAIAYVTAHPVRGFTRTALSTEGEAGE